MAKPVKKANQIHQQLLSGLISTKPGGWTQKVLGKDDNGAEIVTGVIHSREELKSPLAANVSNFNVERAAQKWSK